MDEMDENLTTLLFGFKIIEYLRNNGGDLEEWKDQEDQMIDALPKIYAQLNELELEQVTEEEAYTWLKRTQDVNLLNRLLKEVLDEWSTLKIIDGKTYHPNDLFTYYNVPTLISLMKIETEKIFGEVSETEALDIKTQIMPEEKRIKLSPMSPEETEKNVIEILKEFDPSLKWIKKYYKLKENNGFIDLQPEDENKRQELMKQMGISCLDFGWQCIHTNKGTKIITERTGTLEDTINYLHEFAHYLGMPNETENESTGNNILCEYPSTTLELYGLGYLKKIGYSDKELQEIYRNRIYNTIACYKNSRGILNMLEDYNQGKKVELAQLIKVATEIQELIEETLDEDIKKHILNNFPDYFNPTVQAHELIEEYIDKLIDTSNGFTSSYPYVVGHYLSDLTLKKIKEDPTFCYTCIRWTENIGRINPYEVFETLECDMTGIKNPIDQPKNSEYLKKNEK